MSYSQLIERISDTEKGKENIITKTCAVLGKAVPVSQYSA